MIFGSYCEIRFRIFQLILLGLIVLGWMITFQSEMLGIVQAKSQTKLDKAGTMWAPYLEWYLTNSSYSGNPYDLIATVTFTHKASGETRLTQMFYVGDDTWRFRFTGTRTGSWSFITSSSDPDLDGISGTAVINPNPNPKIKGFIIPYENKFAHQVGENDELEAFLFNVYMNSDAYGTHGSNEDSLLDWQGEEVSRTQGYCNEALLHGFNTIFIMVNNQWLNLGTSSYADHNSVDPDLGTFEVLENIIKTAHDKGCHVHFWAWGDEQRKWTPIGLVGGINGVVDQRVQRYISARLGPLPNWSMEYGFDLHEWVTQAQVEAWGNYMYAHLGWPHLLTARQESSFITPENMDAYSIDDRPSSGFYYLAVSRLDATPSRPVLFSRRFLHTRDGIWSMETTRRALWQFTMAGGAAGWWGPMWGGGDSYPNPEQLIGHHQFWHGRFLLDMHRANNLTDGYALKDAASDKFVFYKEDTSAINLNLAGMEGPQPVIAVDTKNTYAEIYLGEFDPINQVWQAPYNSDWAIAVGKFNRPILSERIFLPAVIKNLPKTSTLDALIPSTGLSASSNFWLVIGGSIILLLAIPSIYLIFKLRRTD